MRYPRTSPYLLDGQFLAAGTQHLDLASEGEAQVIDQLRGEANGEAVSQLRDVNDILLRYTEHMHINGWTMSIADRPVAGHADAGGWIKSNSATILWYGISGQCSTQGSDMDKTH